jgi:ketol-acid reductoisomerase
VFLAYVRAMGSLRANGEAHPIEKDGRELRGMMSWVDKRGDDYVEGTAIR